MFLEIHGNQFTLPSLKCTSKFVKMCVVILYIKYVLQTINTIKKCQKKQIGINIKNICCNTDKFVLFKFLPLQSLGLTLVYHSLLNLFCFPRYLLFHRALSFLYDVVYSSVLVLDQMLPTGGIQ